MVFAMFSQCLITNRFKSLHNHMPNWVYKLENFKFNHFFLDCTCVKSYVKLSKLWEKKLIISRRYLFWIHLNVI